MTMTRTRRPSAQTLAVLTALADEPGRWRYGYDLCTQLGLQAGSMYPILMRLADRGLLETSWETERVPGRPARHLYRLTSTGLAYAETSTASASVASAASAPASGGPGAGPAARVRPARPTRSARSAQPARSARPRLGDT
jgi:PadR family transcriptional regulator, regulatory protein PadR